MTPTSQRAEAPATEPVRPDGPPHPTAPPEPPGAAPDELNRLWGHGLHEEKLFYDRLNYFSAMQVGLLGVFAILYNKDPALGVFLPLTAVALAFTVLWLVVQVRHWRYCVHVNDQIKRAVPEYRRTLAGFAGPGRTDGLSISRPLAFAAPADLLNPGGSDAAIARLQRVVGGHGRLLTCWHDLVAAAVELRARGTVPAEPLGD